MLRALGLGDLLTSVPALAALADAFPDHRRVLAAPSALGPLARLSGAVDEVVGSAPLAPLDRSLHGAAVAVNLHGRGPQSHSTTCWPPCRPGRPGDRSYRTSSGRIISFSSCSRMWQWYPWRAGRGVPGGRSRIRIRVAGRRPPPHRAP